MAITIFNPPSAVNENGVVSGGVLSSGSAGTALTLRGGGGAVNAVVVKPLATQTSNNYIQAQQANGDPYFNVGFAGAITGSSFNDFSSAAWGTRGGLTAVPKNGAADRYGFATLVAGTKTISTTAVGANSRVVLGRQTAGGTLGHLSVANVVNGTSFDILSDSNTDTSVVFWMIVDTA